MCLKHKHGEEQNKKLHKLPGMSCTPRSICFLGKTLLKGIKDYWKDINKTWQFEKMAGCKIERGKPEASIVAEIEILLEQCRICRG
jgi:hypothetical protein